MKGYELPLSHRERSSTTVEEGKRRTLPKLGLTRTP